MIDKNDILREIEQHKDQIKDFGVTEIGVFGSYVRGEQTEASDIDILVDFDKDKKTLKSFLAFCDYIESVFGKLKLKVDVVSKKGLSEFIGPYILKEVEYAKI